MGWFRGAREDGKGAVAAQERANQEYEERVARAADRFQAQVEQTSRLLERQEAALDRYVALLEATERLLGRADEILTRWETGGGR
jgi:hypothetical protein